MWREAARYEPRMGDGERESLLAEWRRARGAGEGLGRPAPPAPARPRNRRRPAGVGTAAAGPAGRRAHADMKPQVYKDERPAEYFDQFHARARKGVGWTYTLVRVARHPADAAASTGCGRSACGTCPKSGPAAARPQPLQPDGPLLHRRLPASQDPLHGEIAALRPARPHLHLQARRRLPGSPRPPRRGGVQDRLHDPRPGRDGARLRRGRALAERRAGRAETPASAGSRWSPASRSSRSPSTAPPRCGAGSDSASPRSRCSSASRSPSRSSEAPSPRAPARGGGSEIFDRVRAMYGRSGWLLVAGVELLVELGSWPGVTSRSGNSRWKSRSSCRERR